MITMPAALKVGALTDVAWPCGCEVDWVGGIMWLRGCKVHKEINIGGKRASQRQALGPVS